MSIPAFIQATDIHPGDELEIEVYLMSPSYGGLIASTHKFADYVQITSTMVKFVVPADFNPVVQAVAAIDAQLDALGKEYHKNRAPLLEKKAQLLQISYGGADVLDAVPKEK